MSINPVRLEELIEQLVEADCSEWERLCRADDDDPEMVALARQRAQALREAPADIPVGTELAGKSLGRFDFVRLLGRGGFGEVWLAFDRKIHRWVALKFLHSRDEQHHERLLGEARASAKLRHPQIVTVHDVVDVPELKKAAIVMELCWESSNKDSPPSDAELAQPLSVVRPKRQLSFRQIAHQARAIALAVAEAHRLGVVHGDLKPENVLVTNKGSLFVTDFGLGKAGSATTDYRVGPGTSSIHVDTSDGEIRGTPCYMAPEQAQAKPATKCSDVYSLGATLFFQLTGQRPYTGASDLEIIRAVAAGQAPTLPRSIPRGLRQLCGQAMSRDPDQRPADAGAMATSLAWWLVRDALKSALKVAAILAVVGLIGLTFVQFNTRHLFFSGDANDAILVRRGLPGFGFPLPATEFSDSGISSTDVNSGKQAQLVASVLWWNDDPKSASVRRALSTLTPASELRWRVYCGDWPAAIELLKRATTRSKLSQSESAGVLAVWDELLPHFPPDAVTAILPLRTDSEVGVRRMAVQSLAIVGSHQPETSVDALRELLDDGSNESIQSDIIAALGEIGLSAPTAVLPMLVETASDPQSKFRSSAANALNPIATAFPEEGAKAIAPMLRADNATTVEYGLMALDQLTPAGAEPVLADVRRIAGQDEGDAAAQATELLGAIAVQPDADTIRVLRKRLASENAELSLAALRGLRRLGKHAPPTLHDPVKQLLTRDDLQVATAALDTLDEWEIPWDRTLADTVVASLQSDSLSERTEMAVLVSRKAPQEFIPLVVGPLVALLDKRDEDDPNRPNPVFGIALGKLRGEIAHTLGVLANQAPEIVIPRLQDVLADREDAKRREAALLAFQFFNSAVAVEANAVARLCPVVSDKNEFVLVRQASILALRAVGHTDRERTAQALLPILSCGDARLELEAAQAFGSLGSEVFLQQYDALHAAAVSEEAGTRRAVARAWTTFAARGETDERLGPAATKLLQDDSPEVRDEATRAVAAWLSIQARQNRTPPQAFAFLWDELHGPKPRLDRRYRACVILALAHSVAELVQAPQGVNAADISESQHHIADLRDHSTELWLRAAAYDILRATAALRSERRE